MILAVSLTCVRASAQDILVDDLGSMGNSFSYTHMYSFGSNSGAVIQYSDTLNLPSTYAMHYTAHPWKDAYTSSRSQGVCWLRWRYRS